MGAYSIWEQQKLRQSAHLCSLIAAFAVCKDPEGSTGIKSMLLLETAGIHCQTDLSFQC